MVRLDFSIELDYEVTQPSEFEFILHASHTGAQRVVSEDLCVSPPVPTSLETLAFFGNRHLRLHAEPGALHLRYAASVEIEHFFAQPGDLREVAVAEMPVDVLHYVRPSRYCPSDRFYQLALQEFGGVTPGYARVQAVSDWVRDRTRFQVGTTNSFHCATDTLNNQVGVCRDFAHLMISVCRALNLPARYVTSLDYGADPALGPMDFHAYVEVYLSGRWFIFDPSGIAVNTGLVRLATGRDANDVAFATIFGNALWSMPRVVVTAVEDRAAGVSLPQPTSLAISTSDAAPQRIVRTPDPARDAPVETATAG